MRRSTSPHAADVCIPRPWRCCVSETEESMELRMVPLNDEADAREIMVIDVLSLFSDTSPDHSLIFLSIVDLLFMALWPWNRLLQFFVLFTVTLTVCIRLLQILSICF